MTFRPGPADPAEQHRFQGIPVGQGHHHVARYDDDEQQRQPVVDEGRPARQESGKGRYQRSNRPLASMTRPPPAVKAALSFWPALNLPVRSWAG